MIETLCCLLQNSDGKPNDKCTRRELIGVGLGLIGNALLIIGHLKKKSESVHKQSIEITQDPKSKIEP